MPEDKGQPQQNFVYTQQQPQQLPPSNQQPGGGTAAAAAPAPVNPVKTFVQDSLSY